MASQNERSTKARTRIARLFSAGRTATQGTAPLPPQPGQPSLSTITDFAFGEIWERPGLTEQERALLSLAVVVALNLEEPMKNYIRACLNVGVPKDKVLEALLHLSMYVGMPLISRGFAAANQVLAEREGTHP